MPADNRSVTIRIKLEDETKDELDLSNQTNTEAVGGSSDKSKKAKSAYTVLAVQALEHAANEIVSEAEYAWSKEMILTDDYIGQRNKQIILTQINRGISAFSTVATYTALGAQAGPVGAMVGAFLGTAMAGLGILRSNWQGQVEQDLALRKADSQLEFTRSRAGWSTHAASIGEDL